MGRRKTQEEVDNEIRGLGNGEYERKSPYQGSSTLMLMLHKTCGTEYSVRFNNFQQGKRCPNCALQERRKAEEEVDEEIQVQGGGEYERLSPYKNNRTQYLMRHKVCGTKYLVRHYCFLLGNRCPNCAGNQKHTQHEFEKVVLEKLGHEYRVDGAYINGTTSVEMTHLSCGCHYKVRPASIFRRKAPGCPNCAGTLKKDTEIYKKEVKERTGHEYEVTGEYINSRTHVRMKHNICGKEFETNPHNFLRGRRCPYCKRSKGEEAVALYLEKQNVPFQTGYKINECRNILPLPFDIFAENPNCLIEYDGIQHFEPTEGFGGIKEFADRQKHDAIKTNYCINHHIPLIRIPYWHFDLIAPILDHTLPFLEEFQPLFETIGGSTAFQLMLEKANQETDPEKRLAYECFLKPYGYVANPGEQQQSDG